MIYLLFLIFLLINKSLENTFSLENSLATLQKDESVTVSSTVGMIFFNSSSFQIDEEIEFEIKATSFFNDEINYEFLDKQNLSNVGDNTFFVEAEYTKNKEVNGQSYVFNYFTIYKNNDNLNGLNGKYLLLTFYCDGNVTIKNGKNLFFTDDTILKKYSSLDVDGSDGNFIFDSNDFKEDEEIYFKIKAKTFIDTKIDYLFVDELSKFTPNLKDSAVSTKSKSEGGYEIYYYTIKKDKQHLHNQKGKYLIIFFYCEGTVTIENIEKMEGNNSNLTTIIAVVIVAVICIGIFAYYCYKRRKRSQNEIVGDIPVTPISVVNNGQNYNQNDGDKSNSNFNVNIGNQNYNANLGNQNYNANNINQNYNANNGNQIHMANYGNQNFTPNYPNYINQDNQNIMNLNSKNQMNGYYNNNNQVNINNTPDVGYTSKM